MLAAASRKNENLELVKLVLSLVSENQENIPDPLKDQLIEIIHQACRLVEAPQQVSGPISPEAVTLAFEMTLVEGLLKDFRSVQDFESISPDMAFRMLERMERDSVPAV